MPSINSENYECYRSYLTDNEVEWKKTQKDEKYQNISNFDSIEKGEEEEEALSALKNHPIINSKTKEIKSSSVKDVAETICEASTCMIKRDIIGALVQCTEALVICDDTQKYNVLIKRSECFARLEEFDKALDDSLQAIKFIGQKGATVPYHRCVRYFINLGMLEGAENFLSDNANIFKHTQSAQNFHKEIEKLRNYLDEINENSKDNEKCQSIINDALKLAPHSYEFLALKIKYLVLQKSYGEAKTFDQLLEKRCGKILKLSDAFKSFYDGSFEMCSFETISTTLKLKFVEDFKEKVQTYKKSFAEANVKFNACNYAEAVSIVHELLLDEDHCYTKIYRKISEVLFNCYSKMRNQDDNLIKYASVLIDDEPKSVKALLARAKAYVNIKSYDKGLNDFGVILGFTIPSDLRQQVSDLQRDVKRICEMEKIMHQQQQEKERAKKKAEEKARIEKEKQKQEAIKQTMNEIQAEKINGKGNFQYKAGQYSNAILLYTDAIKLAPKVEKYYTNRCACYMALGNYEKALPDALKAIDIDPSCWKGYSRAINCFLILGNISQTDMYIQKMQNNIPGIDSIKFNEIPKLKELEGHHAKIVKMMMEKNYGECLKSIENALKIAKECKKYKFWMAECFVMLRQWHDAIPLISQFPKEPHMMYLKGLNAFLSDKFNQSIDSFKEALRFDPEFKEAVKYKSIACSLAKLHEELYLFTSIGNNRAAIETYTQIVGFEHDNEQIKLKAYIGRAELHFKIFKYQHAFEDCSLALRLNIPDLSCDDCIKALLLRAKIHVINQEYDFAIIDCDEVLRLAKGSIYKNDAEKIKIDAKSKSAHQSATNYYEVLQIPPNAPFVVIKEAFRNLSKKFHSDKHPDKTTIEKKKFEKKFQDIRTAFECLKVIHEC